MNQTVAIAKFHPSVRRLAVSDVRFTIDRSWFTGQRRGLRRQWRALLWRHKPWPVGEWLADGWMVGNLPCIRSLRDLPAAEHLALYSTALRAEGRGQHCRLPGSIFNQSVTDERVVRLIQALVGLYGPGELIHHAALYVVAENPRADDLELLELGRRCLAANSSL